MRAVPYVSFNGTCEEAVRFYQSALGGSVDLMRFDALPDDAGVTVGDAWKAKIMHGELTLETGVVIYFDDAWEGAPVQVGSNATVHIQVDDEADVARFVDALSEGGRVTMPVERTFWGSTYGSLVDRYGVQWGIEYEHPKASGA